MRVMGRVLLVLVMTATWTMAAPRPPRTPGSANGVSLETYQTPYYIMHTDLGVEDAREAAIRMTRMAEAYRDRTKGFAGVINRKFQFYLYVNGSDYNRCGGLPGSAGVYMHSTGTLMAIAGEHPSGSTWHIVQHEGFHQFEAAVMGGGIPVWLNEGLAEYFGEGRFTGDNFYTGLINRGRMRGIKKHMEANEFKPIQEIMGMDQGTWNKNINITNYDQAWSMVHFLVHADGGAYQKPFSNFIVGITTRHQPRDKAWKANFGSTEGFKEKWESYWKNLPDDPNPDLETEVTVSTLTSFLARAHFNKMTFANWEEFCAAASEEKIKLALDDNWLPLSLLTWSIKQLGKRDRWSLETNAATKLPRIVVQLSEQKRLVGQFTLGKKKIERVWVEVDDLGETVAEARKLLEGGKKDSARKLLMQGMKDHPTSPAIEDAKKALAETKTGK